MKKIIGLVIASLMFASIGFAGMRMIETKELIGDKAKNYMASTICVDGYKFVSARIFRDTRVSMVQFFEERDGKSLPAKC